jgi:hypothetical protein
MCCLDLVVIARPAPMKWLHQGGVGYSYRPKRGRPISSEGSQSRTPALDGGRANRDALLLRLWGP